MFLGLLITAGTAFVIASSPALVATIVLNRFLFWILAFGQIGLVFYLSARVNKIAPLTAAALFVLYSGLVGVTTSVIFLAYTSASIVSTFIVTAGMFGATAVFGTLTKRSLAGIGHFMFMGLIGHDPRVHRRHLLAKRCAAVCDLYCRCDCFHGSNRVGRSTNEAHGCGNT
jgi:FtsH-binding integral membrane protein